MNTERDLHLPDPLAPMRGLVAAVLLQLAATAAAIAAYL